MFKKNFTIGGSHEKEAEHWNQRNHQRLGEILYLLLLGNKEKRMKARKDYLEMKRCFMEDEWNEYIKKVDDYRESLGAKTLTQFINESYTEMFNVNSKYNPPGEVFHLPVQNEFLMTPAEFDNQYEQVPSPTQCEKDPPVGDCEQMSLF